MKVGRLSSAVLRTAVLKIALVAIPLLLPLAAYIGRFTQMGALPMRLAYAVMLALCVASTLAAAFVRNPFVRAGFAVVFATFLTFWTAYEATLRTFMTYEAFLAMLHARAFMAEAVRQFSSQVFSSAILGLTLLIGISMPPPPRTRRPVMETLTWLSAPLVITAITMVAYSRSGDGLKGLPGHDVTAAYLILLGIEISHSEAAPREPVKLASITRKPDYDVILIVDESVRGDFLDVGSSSGVISASNRHSGLPARRAARSQTAFMTAARAR